LELTRTYLKITARCRSAINARLEGVGVRPTIEVPFDPVYAAGRDPQLDRAVQVLSERIKE